MFMLGLLLHAQVGHWPASEHRTTALARQAACLYLALYFVPGVLHRDADVMRTLVVRSAMCCALTYRSLQLSFKHCCSPCLVDDAPLPGIPSSCSQMEFDHVVTESL